MRFSDFFLQSFFDNYNNCDPLSESFRRSDAFGVEDEINEAADALVESIRNAFAEWIDSVEIIGSANKNSIKLDLSADSSFINFNYTDTLEVLYQIPRDKIFYIHNKAGDFNGELIFGHGQAEETNPKPDELDELGNSNRTMFADAEDAAREVFYAFQKDTEEVIKENDQYFKNLVGISQIMVLGHSLSDVDWPYFQQIAKFAPFTSWSVSYYDKKELNTIKRKAASMLNFEADKITLIKIDDLC